MVMAKNHSDVRTRAKLFWAMLAGGLILACASVVVWLSRGKTDEAGYHYEDSPSQAQAVPEIIVPLSVEADMPPQLAEQKPEEEVIELPVKHTPEPGNVSSFLVWMESWKAGKSELSEGIALAKDQEPSIQKMIEQDPDSAYEKAIPEKDWKNLPDELKPHVARRFEGEGTYYAIHTCDDGVHHHITLDEFSSNDASVSPNLASYASYKGKLIGVALGKHYGLVAMEGGDPIAAAGSSVLPPVSPAASSGSLKILWLSIRASDQTGYPDTVASIETHLNDVTNRYLNFSYGRATFTYTILEVDMTSASGASYSTIQSEANAAALAQGENVANYDFVIYRTTWEGHWAWVGNKYAFLAKRNTMTTVHEMAHCMGLHHSNAWLVDAGQPPWGTGVNKLYEERWDTMAYSDPRGDFNVPEKMKLGWLDAGVDYAHEVPNGVYRLYDYRYDDGTLSAVGVDGAYYGVSIFKDTAAVNGESNNRRYVLSYRDRINEGGEKMTRGLYMHWEPWTYNGSSGYNVNGPYGTDIIDTHPTVNGVNDSLLAIGETYVDDDPGNRDGDIYVTVLSQTDPDGTPQNGDEYVDVKIVVGDQSGNQAPTGTLSFSQATVLPGELVTMTVAGSDGDGDTLAYHWDFGLGTTVDIYNQVLLDGTPVQQLSYAMEGVYTVTATISDCRGGTCELSGVINVSYPHVSVSATDGSAAEAGPDAGVWTLTRSGNTNGSIDVFFDFSGAAVLTDDYAINNASPITIGAGATTATVTLTPVDDSTVEGLETAILSISADSAYVIDTGSATVTIADDDFCPPAVSNCGYVALGYDSASLSGVLSTGNAADAWICWGAADRGTDSTGAWDNVVSIGSVNQGAVFSDVLSSLATNGAYWFRCYVSSPYGAGWSDPAEMFSGTPYAATGGHPWSPEDLASRAAVWLDADDFATITTQAGYQVSQWRDKSVFGHDVSQGNSSLQPVYNAAGWSNGKGQIEFDEYVAGKAHSLGRNVTSDGINGSAYTLFVAVNARSIDSAEWISTHRDTNAKENRYQMNNNSVRVRSDNSNGGSANATYAAGEQIVQFTLDAESSYVRRNGTQIAGNSGTYIPAALTGDFAVNGRSSTDGSYGMSGDIAEFILLTENPDTDTLQNLEGYLAHKWGLTGSLPADHPYKTDPPVGTGPVGNLAPTSVTSTSAVFNAYLRSISSERDVYVYYGTSDAGTNAASWASSAYVGSWTNLYTNLSYTAENLDSGMAYYYTFVASNSEGVAWASPVWTFRTVGAEPTVAAPSGLSATPVSTSQVNLAWSDNSTNETGFLVERSTSSGSGFAGIGSAVENATTYSDTAAVPGMTYYYRITATNELASSSASSQASATVPKMSATVMLDSLAQTYDGNACTATVSTVPAGLSYDVTYDGGAALPTNAGSYAVAATINDISYQGATNGTLVVSKATPNVTQWPAPTSIEVGQAVSSSVLSGGSATAAGSFAFGNPAVVPPMGTNATSVVFTPTDTSNYNSVTGSVDLVVTAALIQETVTLSATNQVYNGAARDVIAATSPDGGLAVSVTYDGNIWAPTNVGSYAVLATVVEAGYKGSTNGTLVVSHATPTVDMWPYASSIAVGQAVSNSVLSGGYSPSSAGAFSFDLPAYVPPVGVYTAAVTFLPDNANYTSLGGTVEVTVLPLPPGVPANLSAVASVGQVDLSWQSVATAVSYNIKRSSVSGSNYVVVGSSASAGYSHTNLNNNTVYYYVVSAVNTGGESANSSEVKVTMPYLLPFMENFESLDVGALNDQNGWLASDAVVRTNVAYGAQAASVTSGVGFAKHEFAGGETNVWTEFMIQPTLFTDGPDALYADTTVAMYFNSNGYPVVYDGTNPVVLTSAPQATGQWMRITLASDYNAKLWDLYIDGSSVTQGIAFYGTTMTNFTGFEVYGGDGAGGVVDNVRIAETSPLGDLYIPEPSGLTAMPVSGWHVTLGWQDNSTNELGFTVERSTNSGSGFAELTSTGADEANYLDTTCTPGMTYYYRVSATNGVATSAYSLEASVTTPLEYRTLTVLSDHGTPVPGGTTTNLWNTSIEASITDSPVVSGDGMTQYVCTGWIATGSPATNGSATNTSFNITLHSTITWMWQTNFWVEFEVIGN